MVSLVKTQAPYTNETLSDGYPNRQTRYHQCTNKPVRTINDTDEGKIEADTDRPSSSIRVIIYDVHTLYT